MSEKELDFVTFCIGSIANRMGMSRYDVYSRLQKSGILSNYIIKHFDVLHTLTRDTIVDEIVDYMKEEGVM